MYNGFGTVIRSVGGLFGVRLFDTGAPQLPPDYTRQPLDGLTVQARGRGVLRRKGALLVGDTVRVSYDCAAFRTAEDGSVEVADGENGIVIEEILPRVNSLIRPPMANLSLMVVTAAATAPEPDTETLDKLLCIAEHNKIGVVMAVTKCDLDPVAAERLAGIYRLAGYPVFEVTGTTGNGVGVLRAYVQERLRSSAQDGHAIGIAAFAGASGVGKSTLLNRIFPELRLQTGEISRKIERGKNTTRTVELYPISERQEDGWFADTPGFTMLDFERFDFFKLDDLAGTFPEFAPYIGACRYKKCTHTKEEGCAILSGIRNGEIARSRHDSYLSLYGVLKKKHEWK